MRGAVIKTAKDKVKEHLDFFIEWGNCLFSLQKVKDIPTIETVYEEVPYKIIIEWVQLTESIDRDHMQFLKIFFNSMMRSLRFETIGRKSFNSSKAHNLAAHKIKVWPGFDARLIMKENGVLLNIDVCFKVVRQDSALDYMNEMKKKVEKRNADV